MICDPEAERGVIGLLLVLPRHERGSMLRQVRYEWFTDGLYFSVIKIIREAHREQATLDEVCRRLLSVCWTQQEKVRLCEIVMDAPMRWWWRWYCHRCRRAASLRKNIGRRKDDEQKQIRQWQEWTRKYVGNLFPK